MINQAPTGQEKPWWKEEMRRQLWLVYGGLAGAASIASVVIILVQGGFPRWGWEVLVAFLVLVFTIPTILLLLRDNARLQQRRPEQFEFYENRSELNRIHGGIEQEIRSVSHAWVAWYAGTVVTAHEVFSFGRVKRMILMDAKHINFPSYAPIFDRTAHEQASDIKLATRRARMAGVEVKWLHGPIINMVMGNPESDDGWVRVEVFIPYTSALSRPSFVVRKSKYPALFEILFKAYTSLWDAGRVPDPTEYTEGASLAN